MLCTDLNETQKPVKPCDKASLLTLNEGFKVAPAIDGRWTTHWVAVLAKLR